MCIGEKTTAASLTNAAILPPPHTWPWIVYLLDKVPMPCCHFKVLHQPSPHLLRLSKISNLRLLGVFFHFQSMYTVRTVCVSSDTSLCDYRMWCRNPDSFKQGQIQFLQATTTELSLHNTQNYCIFILRQINDVGFRVGSENTDKSKGWLESCEGEGGRITVVSTHSWCISACLLLMNSEAALGNH